MPDLDEFLTTEEYDHPKLRYWKSAKEREPASELTVELRRERDGLAFKPAVLYVTVTSPSGAIPLMDSEPWDPELNLALVREGIQARDMKNESQRFGLMLRYLFQPIEVRFGDGYFNSVLIQLIRSSDIARDSEVSVVLDDIHENTPYTEGPSYGDCLERIRSVLAQCGRYLTKELRYSRPQAAQILGAAIAYFLDERFSVTNRKLLGFR